MKYVLILVVVVLMIRIDWILKQFDSLRDRVSAPARTEVQTSEIQSNREIIPVSEDASLKQTPRMVFLALLDDFHSAPEKAVRERAMEYFKGHPTIFTTKLDQDLESTIFRWRDLLNNNEPELTPFLLDLLNILQGENLEMLKRFFSLWMEINMDHFLAAYSKTKDVNCMIVTTFGDNIPEEEKINEYVEREDALKKFVVKEGVNPVELALAKNCLLVLGLEIQKRAPVAAPAEALPVDPDQ